jgi:hypothetical protein
MTRLRAKAAAVTREFDAASAKRPLSEDSLSRTVLLRPPLPQALLAGGASPGFAARSFFSLVFRQSDVSFAETDATYGPGAVRVRFSRRALAHAALRLSGELCGGQPLHVERPALPLQEQMQQQPPPKRARSPPRFAEPPPPQQPQQQQPWQQWGPWGHQPQQPWAPHQWPRP